MGKETTRLRRTFTPQFKKDAVRLVTEEGKSLTEVSAHLGIARSLLQYWKQQLARKSAPEAFPGRGRLTSQAQKVRDLEKKLHDVTQERDILKKALAYFADEQK
jgi:transposase